jgi:hypothetical protein
MEINSFLKTIINEKEINLPKNKAYELGNKFYQGSVFDYDKKGHLEELEKSKVRITICVLEIIEVLKISGLDFSFWEDVLLEVENL